MTPEQKERVQALEQLGGQLDENIDDGLVIVWCLGRCLMVAPDGEVEEL